MGNIIADLILILFAVPISIYYIWRYHNSRIDDSILPPSPIAVILWFTTAVASVIIFMMDIVSYLSTGGQL